MVRQTQGARSLAGWSPVPPRRSRSVSAPAERRGIHTELKDLPRPLLIYLLTIFLPIGFNLGPLLLTGTRLLLMVLIVPLTLRLIRGQYGRVTVTDLFFFFFVFWLLVAMIVYDPSRAPAHVGSVGVEFLGGYLITRSYVRTPAGFRSFCLAMGIFVLATLPLALIEMVTAKQIVPSLLEMIPGIQSARISPPDRRFGLDRVSAIFDHAILYGLVCATSFSLVLISLKGAISTTRRHRLAAIIGFCTFTSVSSAAFIALGMQMALLFWARALHWFPGRWALLAAIGIAVYGSITLIFGASPFDLVATNLTYNPQTAYHRTRILYWGLQNVWNNPWTGIGLGDWKRPIDLYSASVDNFWLLVAMRYGIPAFVAIAIGYILAIVSVSLRKVSGDPSFAEMRRGWVFSMIGLAFVLATVFVWGTAFSLVWSIFGAGIWMIHYRGPEAEAAGGLTARFRAQHGSRLAPTPGCRVAALPPANGGAPGTESQPNH
ncbi:O-antigen ligase family protein [Xanthobacter autotrophicus]|uniref:O-antigen ligase family protein n=1 Tax=Xanthobacter autotrophicus TaxID=280 RepID=UPI0024A779BA|nr:O-antigen ligase family protein [Xanthobacter autotrophicus]MDI4657196.1 O-antigen ligase family protein [Xanthobacter autotrophicus]